ncbi:hypothetical protein [Streptomyces nigrescens]|uniref:hypothetical protein n=1 Tax=Streptomyces nigrescens TaxID=1920 RepID=UPI0036F4C025
MDRDQQEVRAAALRPARNDPTLPTGSKPIPSRAGPSRLGASLHPDFELYDDIGRTTEQFNAYKTHTPTAGDLHRWATYDAAEFTDSLALAESGSDINAWADQLHRARTTAEFYAVTEAVLGDGTSALGALHEFLENAADWCDRNQEPGIADRYRRSADQLDQLGDQLAILGEDHLARTYAPVPAHRAQHGQVPVQTPSERPPGPPPRSAPRRTR